MKIKQIYILLVICGFISSCNKSNDKESINTVDKQSNTQNEAPSSSKYAGGWPVNSQSNNIQDPGYNLPCPGATGCECSTNADCDNQNCNAHPKGNYCVPKKGDLMQLINLVKM